jgi:hypothetical protein
MRKTFTKKEIVNINNIIINNYYIDNNNNSKLKNSYWKWIIKAISIIANIFAIIEAIKHFN